MHALSQPFQRFELPEEVGVGHTQCRGVVVDQIASLTDQSAIDWHNRLVGEIDPAEVGIWTPRHPRPGAQAHAERLPVVEGAH